MSCSHAVITEGRWRRRALPPAGPADWLGSSCVSDRWAEPEQFLPVYQVAGCYALPSDAQLLRCIVCKGPIMLPPMPPPPPLQDGQLAVTRQLIGNNDEVTDLRLISMQVRAHGRAGVGGHVRAIAPVVFFPPLHLLAAGLLVRSMYEGLRRQSTSLNALLSLSPGLRAGRGGTQ